MCEKIFYIIYYEIISSLKCLIKLSLWRFEMNKKTEIDIKNIHCASCCVTIEKILQEKDGINNINVSLPLKKAFISYDDSVTNIEIIDKMIESAGYVVDKNFKNFTQRKEDEVFELKQRFIFILIFSLPLITISMLEMFHVHFINNIIENNKFIYYFIQFILSLIVIYSGKQVIKSGILSLIKKYPNMDSLISTGIIFSQIFSIYSLINIYFNKSTPFYFETSAMILLFISLGKYIEALTQNKTFDFLEKLIKLKPVKANLITNNEIVEKNIEEISIGDILFIKSGEIIPIDGVIIEGEANIDESKFTGELNFKNKKIDDKVIGGSLNVEGLLKIRVITTSNNSTLSKIIYSIENILSNKPQIQKKVDKISAFFIPVIILLGFITFGVWLIFGNDLNSALINSISVFVIACPCALGLATPLSLIAGVNVASKEGILINNSDVFESLSKLNSIIFDKTGTLTKGIFEITTVKSFGNYMVDELLFFAGSIETASEHIIAKSIINHCNQKNILLKQPKNIEVFIGKGIKGEIASSRISIGNNKFIKIDDKLKEETDSFLNEGKIVLFTEIDNKIEGYIVIEDKLRNSAVNTINLLKQLNIGTTILTGDSCNSAKKIAAELKTDSFFGEKLPEDKLKILKTIKNEGKTIAMVGDGVNDSVALAFSDVSISLSTGSDIAIGASDVVLTKIDLQNIYNLIFLSKKVMKNIKFNIFWAFFYNILLIPFAMGLYFLIFNKPLNPMWAAIAMSLSSIFVVLNSLLLKTTKFKTKPLIDEHIKDVKITFNKGKIMKKEISVDGMSCKMCEKHLKRELEANNIKVESISFSEKKVVIDLNSEISDDFIKSIIDETDYKFISIKDI